MQVIKVVVVLIRAKKPNQNLILLSIDQDQVFNCSIILPTFLYKVFTFN